MFKILKVQIQLEQFLVRKSFSSSFTVDYSEINNNSHKFSFSSAIRKTTCSCSWPFEFMLFLQVCQRNSIQKMLYNNCSKQPIEQLICCDKLHRACCIPILHILFWVTELILVQIPDRHFISKDIKGLTQFSFASSVQPLLQELGSLQGNTQHGYKPTQTFLG